MAIYVVVHDARIPYGDHEYAPGDQFDGADWVKSDLAAAESTGLIKLVEKKKETGKAQPNRTQSGFGIEAKEK